MFDGSYFKFLAFFWAAIVVVSRIAMAIIGANWKKWEMNGFYSEKKPFYINLIGIFGICLVLLTWVMVFTVENSYGWILAILLSMTVVKVSTLMFNYRAFREFAAKTLNDKSKMRKLNVVVLILAFVLVLMGLFVY